MLVLGLAVDYNKRPTLRAVLLASTAGAGETVESVFEVPAAIEDELSTQLHDLAAAVAGRIESLRPDVVVVRRADRPQRPNNLDGPRFRLMAEGAVTAASRAIVGSTVVRTGKECASARGSSKEQLESDAARLVSAKLVAACAAALSACAPAATP